MLNHADFVALVAAYRQAERELLLHYTPEGHARLAILGREVDAAIGAERAAGAEPPFAGGDQVAEHAAMADGEVG